MMELVDMNSLGLFDFKSYPFKSDLPYLIGITWAIYFLIWCVIIARKGKHFFPSSSGGPCCCYSYIWKEICNKEKSDIFGYLQYKSESSS